MTPQVLSLYLCCFSRVFLSRSVTRPMQCGLEFHADKNIDNTLVLSKNAGSFQKWRLCILFLCREMEDTSNSRPLPDETSPKQNGNKLCGESVV